MSCPWLGFLRRRFFVFALLLGTLCLLARAGDEPEASMWLRFEGDARAAAGRDGPTLHTEGFGIAELRTQASEHVQLSFRYQRRASGVGVVLFSLSANAAARRGYQVELRDDAVVIAREEDGRVVQLASGALVAAAGAWHEVAVTRAGGRLSVAVGGAEIVGVEDPRPLPPGRVALGSWIGGAFDFRDVRLESKASSAAGREGDRFRLGTGDASVRGEWQLLSGARLEGARAEALHVPAGGRAAWEAQASPSSSLACRFRGNAVVRVGRVGGRSGAGDVWLGVGPEGVRLVLVEGGDEQVLKTAAAPAGLEAWHDLAVHADRGWLRVDLDRVPVIETEVGGLVAAETTDFRAGSSDAVYADVRLVPWQRARVDQIRGALQVKKAPALKPEHPPFAVTPSPVAPRVVPLRSVHYDHPGKWAKDAARIDPGSIPPNYVHTWVLDVAGIAALDFHPYAGNTFQLDAADRLSFFDLDGLQQDPPQPLVVITPASKSNELRIDLSKARTLPLHGKTYCRVFLQLETSPAVKPRRLRLEALLNETANDGDEEILLLGDDLDPTAPYIYPAVDSQGTPTPGISSPFHNDTETGFHAYPPTLEEDGWFLLGRNLTDRSKLFYSLVYYNEARGLLRIFLYNLELPTNVTGFTLTASLVGLAPKPTTPGGPSYLTGQELEGAFFPLHPNPNKWSSARVPLPTWFHGSWTCVEIPIAYPMGSNLPIDLALASPRAPGLYRALYEEPLARGQRVVALRLQVDSYDMGKLEGEWHGKAIGEAIQTLGKSPNGNGFISTDLLKGAAKAGGDIFKGGKKIYEGIKTLEKDTKKNAGNGDDLAKKLSGLVSLGSSVFSGAFGVASAAYSFIDGLFATPRPLTLSIELELSGKLEGTILTEHTPGPFWMCYLPGRFPVEEAYPRGLQVEADVLSNAVPTYDRPIGLFGYAYNPAELPFRMLRWEAGQTAGAPAFVFPAKPTPDLQAGPLSSQQASPLVERFLPVIYNEYSEIVLATPVILGVESEEASLEGETAQTGSAPAEWKKRYRWLSDHAWKAHVVPEPNDASFPSAVQELIGPGFCEMSIVAYLGGLETVYPPLVSTVFANVLPMPEGMVMQIEPKAGIAPYTYRDFPTKELRNFKAMQWYGCRIDANGPGPTARPFEPDDPFPVQDVLFEWAHEYFYYARSRQRADGSVPALRATAHFRSPVTMHVERVASGSSVVPELVVHEIPSAMLR